MSDVSLERDIVKRYFDQNYRVVFWRDEGSQKGPIEKAWQLKTYELSEYREKIHRVGLVTGTEVEPGKFLHDVDIDWAEGSRVAQKILPNTDFVFGRSSKYISHCFYTASEPLQSYKYEDTDGSALLEIRGTKRDGSLGFQTMVPPSIWEHKENPEQRERLEFRREGKPAHLTSDELLKFIRLAAIAMILAKHFGQRGFGHDPRLAWAGFFLRLGFNVEDLTLMGEAICLHTQNDASDVRTVIASTEKRLQNPKNRIKGGPTLAKFLGDTGKAVVSKIYEWLGKDSDFVRNKDGAIIRDHQENVKRAIDMLDVKLSYNEFADKLLINDQPLEDRQLNSLWLQIDADLGFRPTFEFFDKIVRHLAWENNFHPVKQYLDSLVWDKVPRIHTWLKDYGGAEAEPKYLRAVSAIPLIAAVRRVRSPGCKYDEMLILESPQGTEKSSAIAALCPVRSWFTDDLNLNLRSQQLIEATLGKWIIEASELSGKRRAELQQLKAMFSRQVDGPARMAYARLPMERPRHFIFIGTTNDKSYLNDSTGARRYWPVKINRFDVEGIIKVRDQLWAEAAYREAQGESIRLPRELWGVAEQEQEERREMDAWEEIIEGIVDQTPTHGDGKKRIVTGAIWDLLGFDTSRRDRYSAMRISEIMNKLGFDRTKVWSAVDNKTVAGYVSRFTEKLNLEPEK